MSYSPNFKGGLYRCYRVRGLGLGFFKLLKGDYIVIEEC